MNETATPLGREPLLGQVFERVMTTAGSGQTAQLRQELWAWLVGLDWPPDELGDIILACSEAVSNSIEHAFSHRQGEPGRVEVRAEVCSARGPDGNLARRIEISVVDHGRWRLTPASSPHHRSGGLGLMRSCMDSVTVRLGANGTRVAMLSRVTPTAPARHHELIEDTAQDRDSISS